MKYFFCLLFFIFCLNKNIFSQVNYSLRQELSEEEQLSRAKTFFSVMDSMKSLKFDIDKFSQKIKKTIGLTKNWEFKTGDLKISSYTVYPVVTERTWFTGTIFLVIKMGTPFYISDGYSILLRDDVNRNPVCDTILFEAIKKKGIQLPKSYNKEYSWLSPAKPGCSGFFEKLNETEKVFLEKIHQEDSLRQALLSDYKSAFEYKELLDPNYNFDTERPYKDKHIFSPIYLRTIGVLFEHHDFSGLKKLMYTKNNLFNWMAAEAILLFNKMEKFLTEKEIRYAESYNGKKGFAKFRSEVKTLCGYYTKGVVPAGARW